MSLAVIHDMDEYQTSNNSQKQLLTSGMSIASNGPK